MGNMNQGQPQGNPNPNQQNAPNQQQGQQQQQQQMGQMLQQQQMMQQQMMMGQQQPGMFMAPQMQMGPQMQMSPMGMPMQPGQPGPGQPQMAGQMPRQMPGQMPGQMPMPGVVQPGQMNSQPVAHLVYFLLLLLRCDLQEILVDRRVGKKSDFFFFSGIHSALMVNQQIFAPMSRTPGSQETKPEEPNEYSNNTPSRQSRSSRRPC